ncbi:hypothetical protein PENTCL1PPCAC_24120, partial [Pristionchus entomophagus]
MNAVLREVVDSNFGSASLDSLRQLCDAIGRSEAKMIFECQNLSLLFFARSFAVVMEEAVRQLQQLQAQRQLSVAASTPSSSPSSSSSRDDSSSTCSPSPAARTNGAASTVREGASAAVAASTVSLLKRTGKTIDFSPDATESPVIVHSIAAAVKKDAVRAFLSQAGQLEFIVYSDDPSKGYALAKFESNRKADEAVARLDVMPLGGQHVHVSRKTYWTKLQPQQSMQQLQQ